MRRLMGKHSEEVTRFLQEARDLFVFDEPNAIKRFATLITPRDWCRANSKARVAALTAGELDVFNRAWDAGLASVDAPEDLSWSVASVASAITTQDMTSAGYSRREYGLLVSPWDWLRDFSRDIPSVGGARAVP